MKLEAAEKHIQEDVAGMNASVGITWRRDARRMASTIKRLAHEDQGMSSGYSLEGQENSRMW